MITTESAGKGNQIGDGFHYCKNLRYVTTGGGKEEGVFNTPCHCSQKGACRARGNDSC